MKHLARLVAPLVALAFVAGSLGAGTASADTSASGKARTCAHPVFTTQGSSGAQGLGTYYFDPDLWNTGGYNYEQTGRVCGHGNWAATVTTDNRKGDGAVKAYPNIHRDYIDWGSGKMPALSSFSSITSSFATRQPKVGIYDTAYDIWMNGVADENSNEVMIWTHNHKQYPSGNVVARDLKFSGRTWKLYASNGDSYLALVPRKPLNSGTIDLKAALGRIIAAGHLPSNSLVGQICFGFEMVSTDGKPATFKVDQFSLHSSKR